MSPSKKRPASKPRTVFDMRGQKVNRQVNVAGDATIHGDTVAPPAAPTPTPPKVPGRRPGAAPDSPVFHANTVIYNASVATQNNLPAAAGAKKKPATRPGKSAAKPGPGGAPAPAAAPAPETGFANWPDSSPSLLYRVYGRICGIESLRDDALAAAQHAVVESSQQLCGATKGIVHVQAGVFGRIVFTRDLGSAIEAAEEWVERTAKAGVALAVGIALGRVEYENELGTDVLIGPANSIAARLAALAETLKQPILVTEEVFARAQTSLFVDRFAETEPAEETVKQTKLRYHRHTCERPKLGSLSTHVRYRPLQESCVVAFDIEKFSQENADGQWKLLRTLEREVKAVLKAAKIPARAEAGHAWYCRSGDGGVLVLSPDDEGPDAAWQFARRLIERCQGKVAIRLGATIGSTVAVEGQFPMGKAVLRADAFSAYPPALHVCVDQAFWADALNDNDRALWQAKTVRENPKARILWPPGSIPPDDSGDESEEMSRQAKVIVRQLVDKIRAAFEKYPPLRDDLEAGLRSKSEPIAEEAADILQLLWDGEVSKVLELLGKCIPRHRKTIERDELLQLMDDLTCFGVRTNWLAEARAKVGPINDEGTTAIIRVSAGVDLPVAEVLKAAVTEGQTKWADIVGEEPVGEGGFHDSYAGEDRAPALKQRLASFRQFLRTKYVFNKSADPKTDDQKLAEYLKKRWVNRRALYLLADESDPLLDAIRRDTTLPWHFILIMKRDASIPKVVNNAGIAFYVADVLKAIGK